MRAVALNPALASVPAAAGSARGSGESAPRNSAFASVLTDLGQKGAGAANSSDRSKANAPSPAPEAASPPSEAPNDPAPLALTLARASTGSSTGARSSGSGGAASKPNAAAKDNKDTLSIEVALAALGYGAVGPVAGAPLLDAKPRGVGDAPPQAKATSAGGGVSAAQGVAVASPRGLTGSPSPSDVHGWDSSGAVPMRDLLNADPSLRLQSLQPRTHLAVANAIPARASAEERRPTAMPNATLTTHAVAAVGEQTMGNRGGFTSSPTPPRSDKEAAAAPGVSAAAPALAIPGLDPGASAFAPVSLDQLPDFVADQASSLTSRAPSIPAGAAPMAPQAVKELEIALDPADLGAVSLKMRLSNGKLSIVIGVASATTLSAIESERGAIADRLGSRQHPLEDLIIRSQGAPISNSEGLDASDPEGARQFNANGDPAGARRGDGGGFSRGREGSPPRGATALASPRGGRGDLLV
jgi:chemotaxis protein MotD